MATSTVENYIKQIYSFQFDKGQGDVVGMGELATSLNVTPGTATSMVKTLAKSGHVDYVPRVGVKLTREGENMALRVLRRHRLIEQFLVKTLGMEWHEIHEEAEALEHVVSDKVLERIDALLGHPKLDPHGDPIPSASGAIAHRDLTQLDECKEGARGKIGRIEDQEGAFLRYLESSGLMPGTSVEVVRADSQAGIITVRFADGKTCSLGFPAARKIHVELARRNA